MKGECQVGHTTQWTTRSPKLRTFLEMEEAERRAISGRIAQARKEAGLTQAQLAELLGLHKRTIENYEAGRIPWEHLQEIAKLTGRTREWILRGDEAATETQEIVRQVVREEMADALAALARLEAQLGNGERPFPEEDETG